MSNLRDKLLKLSQGKNNLKQKTKIEILSETLSNYFEENRQSAVAITSRLDEEEINYLKEEGLHLYIWSEDILEYDDIPFSPTLVSLFPLDEKVYYNAPLDYNFINVSYTTEDYEFGEDNPLLKGFTPKDKYKI